MQAHIFGEVGNLGTILLTVYSGTMLPIFIKIGLYLTDKEHNISWHSFLRHGVEYTIDRPIFIIILIRSVINLKKIISVEILSPVKMQRFATLFCKLLVFKSRRDLGLSGSRDRLIL